MAEKLRYSNKINKIRTFALVLIFGGMILMYIGLFFRSTEWLMLLLFIIGTFSIVLSVMVYVWIGTLSLKAVPVTCPNCEKPTKMLGRVDACMHCKQPLTMDPALDGEEFDEKYNTRKYAKEKNSQK